MTDEVKRIEVDIAAAAAALQSSPELCAMMNELVGGPALIEAQAEIERLQKLVDALAPEALKALEKFVPIYEEWMDDHRDDERLIIHRTGNTFGDLRRARAALTA